MPDTLPRSEPAAPSFPVKHLPSLYDKNAVLSPSPSTRAGSITATPNGVSVKQRNGQDLTPFALRGSTIGEHSPLLSERESIFATHYIPVENDSSTPRLPPSAGAVSGSSPPQSLESDMEFSLPPRVSTSRKPSFRSSLTAACSGPGVVTSGLRQYGHTGSEKLADKQLPFSNGATQAIRRVASDGHPWARSFHIGGDYATLTPGSEQPQAIRNTTAMEDNGAQVEVNAIQPTQEQEQDHGQGAQHQSAMSQAMRPTRSARSLSRGRTHVDKSIEATLANTEPGKNIRSRKSSHLMGVFRENTTSMESRSRDVHIQHGENVDANVQSISRPGLPSERTSSRPISDTVTAAITAQSDPVLQESVSPEQNHLFVSAPDQRLYTEPSSIQDSGQPSLPQTTSTQTMFPSKHEHDPYFRKQDAIRQSKESQGPQIPANLLEQVREHHNLVPMRGHGSDLPQARTGFTSHENTDFASRRQLRAGDVGGHADDNEEHISSAVYFPHPTPSLEEIERFSVREGDSPISGAHTDIGATATIGGQTHNDTKRLSIELAPPEHIDISVQSKHEKRVFHGDYQPSDETPDKELDRDVLPTITERLTENYTLASDSDIESVEDFGVSSQTDDAETTPTATAVIASQLPRGKRASISTGPKGAVVLEPYSHQVGGHSTIFRFSRRAVCKRLNNRENEFYERIERRHPDMLCFLPRYIGVLNVTFSKGPKPSKEPSGEAHKVPEGLRESKRKSQDTVNENMNLADPNRQKHPLSVTENEQRIVSQSQQIGERPQVILEQNRHIVPFSLFDSAGRPRTAEPEEGSNRRLSKSTSRELEITLSQASTSSAKDSSHTRPLLPSPPSWGKTTVNSKFGEQILRDVFGAPQMHHKKHTKGHSTPPGLRDSMIRRKNAQHTASLPPEEGRAAVRTGEADISQGGYTLVKTFDLSANTRRQDASPASESAFEDLSRGLEKVRTTNRVSSEGSQVSVTSHKIRRRHSGMGLRQEGESIHDKSRGNLEYYEEEGYGGGGEQEGFHIEQDGGRSRAVSARPSGTVLQELENGVSPVAVHYEGRSIQAHGDVGGSLLTSQTNGIAKQSVPNERSSPDRLPLNPKEAQLAKPDQRVVFFLLLEDLTADMGRPCVLDLKMGTRQYGIEATPKKMESQRRKCKTTTSQQLGVRICGMQTFDLKKQQPAYEDKYFGRDLKAGREFREALTRFLYDGVSYSSVTKRIPTILDKLGKLENIVRRLPGYRFYASSLLMLYDAEPEKSQRAEVKASEGKGYTGKNIEDKDRGKDKKRPPPIELKIVDFANCVTGEDPLPPNAPCPPFHPGTVDRGYLRGLRTLKMYFQHILRDITENEFVDRGDGEATGVDMMGAGATPGGSEIVTEEDDGEVSI